MSAFKCHEMRPKVYTPRVPASFVEFIGVASILILGSHVCSGLDEEHAPTPLHPPAISGTAQPSAGNVSHHQSQYTSSWRRMHLASRCKPLITKFRAIQGYGNPPLVWTVHQYGLGDRLRGLMNSAVTAMMLNRTFLADLSSPEFDSRFIVNALPDVRWTINHTELDAFNKTRHTEITRLSISQPKDFDHDQGVLTRDTQYFSETTVRWLHHSILNGTLSSGRIRASKYFIHMNYEYCVFHMLLRPTEEMTTLVERYLTQARPMVATASVPQIIDPSTERTKSDNMVKKEHGDLDTLIVGLHVRFGGRWGDSVRATDVDALFVIKYVPLAMCRRDGLVAWCSEEHGHISTRFNFSSACIAVRCQ